MRSTLAGIVAVLALAVALPAAWVATHVTSQDGFVGLVAPLATDESVRGAVANEVSTTLSGEPVPTAVREVVRRAVQAGAERVAADPGWQRAWDESVARTHTRLFDDRTGGIFVIDAAPVAQYVLDRLGGALPVRVEAPATLPVVAEEIPDRRGLDAVRRAPTVAIVGGAVALVAAVLTLVLARTRSAALIGLGVGAVVVGAVEWLALRAVAEAGLREADTATGAVSQAVSRSLVEHARDSASGWAVTALVVGAVATVLGLVARAVSGGREPDAAP